jgi:hypothetical protein
MKKKSSEQDWPTAISIVGLLGLFAILTFAFRAVTMPGNYSVVSGEIPLVPAVVDDPAFHNFEENTQHSVREQTMAVMLTTKGFYFGDLSAFSRSMEKKGGRYVVPHVDNTPRTGDLIEEMAAWRKRRQQTENVPDEHILVFVPSGDIPMPIVIQVMAQLREHGNFERIILGGGFVL